METASIKLPATLVPFPEGGREKNLYILAEKCAVLAATWLLARRQIGSIS